MDSFGAAYLRPLPVLPVMCLQDQGGHQAHLLDASPPACLSGPVTGPGRRHTRVLTRQHGTARRDICREHVLVSIPPVVFCHRHSMHLRVSLYV